MEGGHGHEEREEGLEVGYAVHENTFAVRSDLPAAARVAFRMNFRFSNLLGAPYRGGNLLIHNNELLTPVGNRVGQIDLVNSTSKALPHENLKQARRRRARLGAATEAHAPATLADPHAVHQPQRSLVGQH